MEYRVDDRRQMAENRGDWQKPGDGDQVSGVRKQIMEFGSGEAESKESMGKGI